MSRLLLLIVSQIVIFTDGKVRILEFSNGSYLDTHEVRLREDETKLFLFIFSNTTSSIKTFRVEDSVIAKISGNRFLGDEVEANVTGAILGRTKLIVETSNGTETVAVRVVRGQISMKITKAFTITTAVLIAGNFIIMGFHLQPKVIKEVIRKPFAPMIGFGCQYVFMPLLATLWGFLLMKGQMTYQLGYFIIGCCPGGGATNKWTLLLDGNLDLSVTMTFISMIAALGMMPFWIYTLGSIFQGGNLKIPYEQIALSLAIMTVPILIGMVIKYFRPSLAESTRKLVRVTSLIVLIIFLPFGLYANWFLMRLITWKVVLCAMLLPYTGYVAAYFAAWLLRRDYKDSLTIGIEASIQNVPVCVVLLNSSLEPPDNDTSLVIPVTILFFTQIPFFIALFVKMTKKWINNRKEKVKQSSETASMEELKKDST